MVIRWYNITHGVYDSIDEVTVKFYGFSTILASSMLEGKGRENSISDVIFSLGGRNLHQACPSLQLALYLTIPPPPEIACVNDMNYCIDYTNTASPPRPHPDSVCTGNLKLIISLTQPDTSSISAVQSFADQNLIADGCGGNSDGVHVCPRLHIPSQSKITQNQC